ncbi:hypothetical protein LIA77_08308 [Sarocladium implicatum]|nr:hypothetical protein LIA77_08308 [Sarocladium implicatum]
MSWSRSHRSRHERHLESLRLLEIHRSVEEISGQRLLCVLIKLIPLICTVSLAQLGSDPRPFDSVYELGANSVQISSKLHNYPSIEQELPTVVSRQFLADSLSSDTGPSDMDQLIVGSTSSPGRLAMPYSTAREPRD